jgi:hypothetical protein
MRAYLHSRSFGVQTRSKSTYSISFARRWASWRNKNCKHGGTYWIEVCK